MKKVENSTLTDSIPRTKLYLDDVEYVLSKLSSLNLNIEISDDDNVYDSLEELIQTKGLNPKLIKIFGKQKEQLFGFILIRLSNLASTVHVQNDEKLLKIGYEIEKYLTSRKRKKIYAFFNSQNAKLNIVINSVLAVGVYIYSTYVRKTAFNYIVWICIVLLWIFIFFLSELNPDSNTKIELDRKHNLNFYEKNKDKIILALLGVAFGALVTFLINYLRGR